MSLKTSFQVANSMGETLPPSKNNTGRNKVFLKPGRSLMDWIRFTHSGQDLTSVGGKPFDVSPEELGKHNKKEDAWICLKGKVYNITPYLEYHPGGEDELMRGAGKDATDLFNQIHKWVNAESMLQKCYVGRMKMGSVWLQKATAFRVPKLSTKSMPIKSDISSLPGSSNIDTIDALNCEEVKIEMPKYDWFQSEKSVNIHIYNKWKEIKSEHIIFELVVRDMLLTLRIRNYTYQMHLELEGTVLPNVEIKIGKCSGSVEIVLTKDISEGLWADLGKPLVHHNSFFKTDDSEIRFRPCKLISKSPITHDTHLLTFSLPSGTRMVIPVGYHIHVKACIRGMEIIRSYTAVLKSLDISPSDPSVVEGELIHLMIKIYPNGVLTPIINDRQVGSTLLISDYMGNFSESHLETSSSIIMLAAGTGFTPMIKIIHWTLKVDENHDRLVSLIFFNKTEEDIPWKQELESLSKKSKRFIVYHVLSNANGSWVGRKGRINKQLLQDLLPVEKTNNELICVCGPTQFTQSALELLEDLGYMKNSIHAFAG